MIGNRLRDKRPYEQDTQTQTVVTSKSEAEIKGEIAQLNYRPHISAKVTGIQFSCRFSYVEASIYMRAFFVTVRLFFFRL